MARITNETIILKFKSKHGDLYDYSLVEYINYITDVKIICKIHNIFKQTPFINL
jgi:hypothetical protein